MGEKETLLGLSISLAARLSHAQQQVCVGLGYSMALLS